MASSLWVAAAIGLFSLASFARATTDQGVVTSAVYTTETAEAVQTLPIAYTTASAGRRAQWEPVRPTKEEVARRLEARNGRARKAPTLVSVPMREVDPFADPFGDMEPKSQLPLTPNLPGDEMLAKPTGQPSTGATLPSLEDDRSFFGDGPFEEPERMEIPSLEEALAAGPETGLWECPTPDELKSIREITQDVSPSEGTFPQECGLGEAEYMPRCWAPTTFAWKASGLCHKPLYFEQVHLERYGHSAGPYLQPLFSGAHFFLNVPILPYNMGLFPPGECIYTLGYYRPGNCAPYMLDPLPLSIRAALAEGGVWTGMAFAIP